MAVGQAGQVVATLSQVVGRAALGNHQGQYLAQGQAALGQAGLWRARRVEQQVDLGEVCAEPDTQAIGQAMHLTMSGGGRERHAVEVIAHDVFSRGHGLRAALVGTYAGREHLPQLFRGRQGQAIR